MPVHTQAMSEVREAERGEDQRSGRGWRIQPSRLVVAVLVGLLLVSLGYYVGDRSSWTAHRPHAVSGTAWREPADIPVAFFDPGNGDAIQFRLDDVVWKSGDETGDNRVPPCLREPSTRVVVEAGVIEVSRPYGDGFYFRVVSVTCPAR